MRIADTRLTFKHKRLAQCTYTYTALRAYVLTVTLYVLLKLVFFVTLYRVTSYSWCTVAYTSVTNYKVPELHGHVYLVTL